MTSKQERTIPGYSNKMIVELLGDSHDNNSRETVANFYADALNKPVVVLHSKTRQGCYCVYIGDSKKTKLPIITDRLTFSKPSLLRKFFTF